MNNFANQGQPYLAMPAQDAQSFRPMTFRRLIRPFRDHPRLLGLAFGVPLVVIFLLTSLMSPSYDATANILVEERRVELGEIADVVTPRAIDNPYMSSQIEIILSQPVLMGVAKTLGIITDGDDPVQTSKTLDQLKGRIDVSRRLNSFVIDVTATAGSAESAAKTANAIADEYLSYQINSQSDAAGDAIKWMEGETAGLRAKINDINQRIATLRSGILAAKESDLSTVDNQIELLSRQISDARLAISQAETSYSELVGVRQAAGALAAAELLDVAELNRQLSTRAQLSEDLAAERVRRNDAHPAIIDLKTRITAIEAAIEQQIDLAIGAAQSDVNIGRERLASLERAVLELRTSAIEFSPTQLQLNELEQELEANQDLYQALVERQSEIASQRLSISTDARILASARAPTGASGPRRTLLSILAGMFGLMCASAYILAREAISDRFESAEELEEETGIRIITTHKPLDQPAFPLGARTLERLALPGLTKPLSKPLENLPAARLVPRYDNIDLVLFPGHNAQQNCLIVALTPLRSKASADLACARLLQAAKLRNRSAIIVNVVEEGIDAQRPEAFADFETDEISAAALDHVLDPRLGQKTVERFEQLRRNFELVIIDLPSYSQNALAATWTGFADRTYIVSEDPRPRRAEIANIRFQTRAYGGDVSGIFMVDS